MKLGVFGSSFNPIHIAHLIIADQARIRLNLDKVIFIPTLNPYHKNVDLVKYEDRINMVNLAIENNIFFEVSDLERDFKSNSYSYNVVKKIKEDFPKDEIYFILGSDSFLTLDSWYKYEDFIKMVNIVVFSRPFYDIDLNLIKKYDSITNRKIYYYKDLNFEISSSSIRKSIKSGYIPKYIIPDKVIKYIEENNLWS